MSIVGDTALIGAWGDDDNGPESGSAYVFVRDGSRWTEQAKLLADDGAPTDRFGTAVSLFGETASVGVPGAVVDGVQHFYPKLTRPELSGLGRPPVMGTVNDDRNNPMTRSDGQVYESLLETQQSTIFAPSSLWPDPETQ